MGQNTFIKFYKANDKLTYRKVKVGAKVSIGIVNSHTDTLKNYSLYQGKINLIKEDTIILDLKSINNFSRYASGLYVSNCTIYSSFDTVKKCIHAPKIDFIKYQNRIDFHIFEISILTFTLSAITTLIIAPIISYSFKDKCMNNNRYRKWAGVGIAGMGISLPIALISKNKKMKVNKEWNFIDRTIWIYKKE